MPPDRHAATPVHARLDPAAEHLVEHLRAAGIADDRVLEALRQVPREQFVPAHLRHLAHVDEALPIGHGQTISQPYVVAVMTEALELAPDDRVLEVGTGSGYQAAVLGRLAAEVVTVERIPALAAQARAALAAVGARNVTVHTGDGRLGRPTGAPFDAVVVTAAGPEVPPALVEQLGDGGRLVAPVGPPAAQVLVLLRRRGEAIERTELDEVRFVPLRAGVEGTDGQPADVPTGERSL